MPMVPDKLMSRIGEFRKPLIQEIEKDGFNRKDIEFRYLFNMRYKRQVNYHTVSLPAKEYRTEKDVQEILDSWIEDFEKIYGKGVTYTKAGVELVSMDLDGIVRMTKPALKRYREGGSDSSSAIKGQREVFFPDITKDFLNTNIYEYSKVKPNNVINGPAILESPTSNSICKR